MRVSIMAPGNSSVEFHHIEVREGRLIQPKGMDEDSFEAVKGIVAKALIRDNPAALAGVNPLDRLAAAFEKIAEKIPDENGSGSEYGAKAELAKLKAKLLLTESVRASLTKAHGRLYDVLGMKSLQDLAQSIPYELSSVTLVEAIKVLAAEVTVHDVEVASAAVEESGVCKPTCIKHGLAVCKECSDISSTRRVPPNAY